MNVQGWIESEVLIRYHRINQGRCGESGSLVGPGVVSKGF